MISSESTLSLKLAKKWSRFGLSLTKKQISEKEINEIIVNSSDSRNKIMIELHYALNHFFIEGGYIFQHARLIKTPTTIIHGSYDYLCPLTQLENRTT
ncbi:MAG: proline iminopeptidase [Halioglobus sp.]|jgi:proline iminopeptidase